MIIGINASYLGSKNKTGVENFSTQLILSLLSFDTKNFYYLFSSRPIDRKILPNNNNYKLYISPFPKGWHRFRLPLSLLRHKVDIFFDPGYTVPPFISIPSVVCIHDLAFKYYPEAYSKSQIATLERSFNMAKNKASGLIFSSQNTLIDFEKYYPDSSANKVVIYQSFPDKEFNRLEKSSRDILHLTDKYIFFVGRLEHRKNVVNLIRAYVRLRHQYPTITHKLVLAGSPGFGYGDISLEIQKNQKFGNDILELGFVKERELPHLYHHADLFIYPSLYEGFGIPILEAMKAMVPMSVSHISSIPEVAGNSAFYFNPKSVESMTETLYKSITEQKTRNILLRTYDSQLSKFTWSRYCDEFLKFINRINNARSNRT